MYFPLSELHGWDKRFADQPKTIYSEIPKLPHTKQVVRAAGSFPFDFWKTCVIIIHTAGNSFLWLRGSAGRFRGLKRERGESPHAETAL